MWPSKTSCNGLVPHFFIILELPLCVFLSHKYGRGWGGKKGGGMLSKFIVGVIFSPGSGLLFHSLHNTGHSCALLSLCCRLSNTYMEMCGAALLTRALPLALYTLLVTHMRYHLFVWTVFSPKLLYEGMLTVVMSGFCGACLWMASALKKSSKV